MSAVSLAMADPSVPDGFCLSPGSTGNCRFPSPPDALYTRPQMSPKRKMPDIESFSRDAAVLSQALPYMQRYEGKTVVVKYGGHAMGEASLGQAFARDIALLKQSKVNPIVVHGGGPQIASM